MSKNLRGVAVLASLILIAGCATTGPSRQTDIDALNARVTALQGQLAEKDQEISKLKGEMEDQKKAREAAEQALQNTENDQRAFLAAKKKMQEQSDLK